MSDGELLEVEGLNAYYGAAHVLQGLDFTVGEEPVVDHRPQRHGQDDDVPRHHGDAPEPDHRLGAFWRARADRQALLQDRRSRPGARSPRPAPVRVVDRRRAPQHRRQQAQRTVDGRPHLRAFPAAGRTPEERRRAAVGGRAADARDRPRAADATQAADHGRAVRGARADDRRELVETISGWRRRASASCWSSRTSGWPPPSPSASW